MYKKVKLISHDCLPILMPLYIMLAYLMLFAALTNAVFFIILLFFFFFFFANAFCFMLCLGLFQSIVFIFQTKCEQNKQTKIKNLQKKNRQIEHSHSYKYTHIQTYQHAQIHIHIPACIIKHIFTRMYMHLCINIQASSKYYMY